MLAKLMERLIGGQYLLGEFLHMHEGHLLTQDACSVGLVSSLHARACELFYSLVGGTGEYLLVQAFCIL